MNLRVVRVPDGWVLSEASSPWRLLRQLGVFSTRRDAVEAAERWPFA